MKQIIKIIRKVDVEEEYRKALKAELDYELLTLNEAIQSSDDKQREKSLKRCHEIKKELDDLESYR